MNQVRVRFKNGEQAYTYLTTDDVVKDDLLLVLTPNNGYEVVRATGSSWKYEGGIASKIAMKLDRQMHHAQQEAFDKGYATTL